MMKNLLEHFFSGIGRISRSTLFYRLLLLSTLCAAFGSLADSLSADLFTGFIAGVYLWCACALCVQRLHDIGRSGYMLIYFIIPVIGPIWLVTQLIKRGAAGSNPYGDDPTSRNDYLTVTLSR